MKYGDLIFPQGLNLHLLAEVLDEEKMMKLILKNEGNERKARRIILPSRKLLRKCVIYYYVKRHGEDFEKVLKKLKGNPESSEDSGLRIDKIIELYEQRVKEIRRENE